jgi:glycosyltransferase involved in cell wall biosynthesis
MVEVSRQLQPALPEGVGDLTSFPVEAGAVEGIAARLSAWLALPEPERERAREALVETVARLWSWEGVARGVLAAAAGDLGDLPRPGS